MKNVLRRFTAIAVIGVLCLCLLAGCGSEKTDTDSTTTVGDVTTTDGGTTTAPTKSTASGKGSKSSTKKPTQSGTGTSKQNNDDTPAPIASVAGIQIGGTALSGFSSSKTDYIHFLPVGTTAAPKVTATKTGGTGDISITQANGANGAAKVSLNDVTYTIQFVVKRAESDILNNTYYQLKKANKLNIAYLGGSVTVGTSGDTSCTFDDSWRAQTPNWFKSQYPSATITETNAGIGGTGSMYGAYRVIQDLKLQSATEKPDLVFIEFAANDRYDEYVNKTPDVYVESIIR
ncbi:MAG: SGNH/GDSL hydrolase family protein, partial [Clostridia bacterium]|nr:SGNH/GDSL hydrolase family protein [Clostridia bacterium]